jgi:hypothetical protein
LGAESTPTRAGDSLARGACRDSVWLLGTCHRYIRKRTRNRVAKLVGNNWNRFSRVAKMWRRRRESRVRCRVAGLPRDGAVDDTRRVPPSPRLQAASLMCAFLLEAMECGKLKMIITKCFEQGVLATQWCNIVSVPLFLPSPLPLPDPMSTSVGFLLLQPRALPSRSVVSPCTPFVLCHSPFVSLEHTLSWDAPFARDARVVWLALSSAFLTCIPRYQFIHHYSASITTSTSLTLVCLLLPCSATRAATVPQRVPAASRVPGGSVFSVGFD